MGEIVSVGKKWNGERELTPLVTALALCSPDVFEKHLVATGGTLFRPAERVEEGIGRDDGGVGGLSLSVVERR